MVVFGQSGCIRAKWVVIEQKWLFSGKLLYSGKSGCIRAKVVLSGKLVVFGQKWLYSGQSVFNPERGYI